MALLNNSVYKKSINSEPEDVSEIYVRRRKSPGRTTFISFWCMLEETNKWIAAVSEQSEFRTEDVLPLNDGDTKTLREVLQIHRKFDKRECCAAVQQHSLQCFLSTLESLESRE